MSTLFDFDELPAAADIVMIAGWRQWADGGSVSSGLPQYLIEHTRAAKIGSLQPEGYYLFQVPGTHHLLRPQIRLEDGYRRELEVRRNEFFYAGDATRGLVIFLGDEPHMNVERYAEAFFAAVKALNVHRIIGLGGVYAPVPFSRDRQISCIYSLKPMREELAEIAVAFSNYEGGSSIGSYLVSEAEGHGISYASFYALVPAYDFPQLESIPHGIRVENDFRAWHNIMHRINYLLGLSVDLGDLQRRSEELTRRMEAQVDSLEESYPQLGILDFMERLEDEFEELSFTPLDDVWEQEFDNLFGDEE